MHEIETAIDLHKGKSYQRSYRVTAGVKGDGNEYSPRVVTLHVKEPDGTGLDNKFQFGSAAGCSMSPTEAVTLAALLTEYARQARGTQ